MKRNLAIFFVCLVYLCSCTGLSDGDGSDTVNSISPEQDASLLNRDPGTDNAAENSNIAPPGIPSILEGSGLIITGTKFDDLNGDGLRSEDEFGLPDRTIVLKRDGMDYLQTTTDDEGRYSFANLLPGIYTVSEINVTGWNQTAPGGGSYEINMVDKDAIDYDFGEHLGPERSVPKTYPIMSRNAWLKHSQGVKSLSKTEAFNAASLCAQANTSFPPSFSLLNNVPYVPDERDQGACGNCWVWGCTVPIEIANYFQNNISDRLSIQYLNSNYNGGTGSWACCGGWEGSFTNFYNSQKNFIPWSNTNANYRDGNRQCGGSTGVPAGSISTTPSYPINSIQWHLIPTRGSGITQDQAINNIKAILNQNKAVTLGFYLPDFSPFFTYWSGNSGVWNPDLYCGLPDGAYPGGHEVTIVGYDDSSPTNHYWIVLNSWGTDNAHPDGTYKVEMHMNYGCTNSGYYSYDFGYFDVDFSTVNTVPNEPIKPIGPDNGTTGSSYTYFTSATDPDGDRVRYAFDWGDGTAQTQTELVDSGSNASASHVWNTGGAYLVRALAQDNKSASSGWSEALTVAINEPPNSPPNTPSRPYGTSSGKAGTTYLYTTYASDPDGDQVKYTFDWGDGTTSETGYIASGTQATGSHAWSSGGTYLVKAMANDSEGANSGWSVAKTVIIAENNPPRTPAKITGLSSGKMGITYSYATSTTDPDRDKVKYTFDWGDETTTTTGDVTSGLGASRSHTWSSGGTYLVKAMATDINGANSGWSVAKTVTIAGNSPPRTPAKPTGLSSGKMGTSYNYATYAADPDRDKVKYTFDWGDGTTSTTGDVNSGSRASRPHIWSSGGTYLVRAMATDNRDADSGWSSSLSVRIT